MQERNEAHLSSLKETATRYISSLMSDADVPFFVLYLMKFSQVLEFFHQFSQHCSKRSVTLKFQRDPSSFINLSKMRSDAVDRAKALETAEVPPWRPSESEQKVYFKSHMILKRRLVVEKYVGKRSRTTKLRRS